MEAQTLTADDRLLDRVLEVTSLARSRRETDALRFFETITIRVGRAERFTRGDYFRLLEIARRIIEERRPVSDTINNSTFWI